MANEVRRAELAITNLICKQREFNSRGYTHLGFGTFRRVNGLGWVQLRFHVTLGDAVTQKKTTLGEKYN